MNLLHISTFPLPITSTHTLILLPTPYYTYSCLTKYRKLLDVSAVNPVFLVYVCASIGRETQLKDSN